MRAELGHLGRGLFGRDVGADELLVMREYRGEAAVLERLGYPRRLDAARVAEMAELRDRDVAMWLVAEYLTSRRVFAAGLRMEEVVVTGDEERMLGRAQAWLRERIAGLEITVESNPSSNLLIGDMGSVDDHPVFQLQPRQGRLGAAPGRPVHVSVSDDDPMTFATSLGDEYAHVYHALLRAGLASEEALEWLERARLAGVESRFTVAASAEAGILADLAGRR